MITAILIALLVLSLGAVVFLACALGKTRKKLKDIESRIVVLTDKCPADRRPSSKVMQLQNELKHYIKEKGGKIFITVLR